MADEVFRPRKSQNYSDGTSQDEIINPMQPNAGMEIKGNVPKEFLQALQMNQNSENAENQQRPSGLNQQFSNLKNRNTPKFSNGDNLGPETYRNQETQSNRLKELLSQLNESKNIYDTIQLPSKGKFYDGNNGPADGVLHIRQMTGDEEQILGTPRFIKKGQAINMIFKRCISENYQPENLLTVDRTYLLIYLRSISYTNHYEVEIKCPECEKKFLHDIDLANLFVEKCPDEFGPMLEDTLPTTGLKFQYRFQTGRDEQEITEYRERRLRNLGPDAADDSLIYRTSTLLDYIDGITDKTELQILLKNLPINDGAYIRNCINEPPFGVDTKIEIICANCFQEFNMELPLESNFFFPRNKKGVNTQA